MDLNQHTVKVYRPVASTSSSNAQSPANDLPDSFFQPTTHELAVAYNSQSRNRERLTEAPLLTRRLRDEQAANKAAEKRLKYPTTKIRIKFADQTQIETVFASNVCVDALYAFVATTLREELKDAPFMLYQTPPRKEYSKTDAKIKTQSMWDLNFAPSSMLYIKFENDALNDRTKAPPLLDSLLATIEDLPPPKDFNVDQPSSSSSQSQTLSGASAGEKKALPKWLNKTIGKK